MRFTSSSKNGIFVGGDIGTGLHDDVSESMTFSVPYYDHTLLIWEMGFMVSSQNRQILEVGRYNSSFNFRHTASISDLKVYDSEGNLVPDATIQGSDGYYLLGGPTVVPEPSTILLYGSGLAVLGLAAWRRKK
jgi:hypothetical protein